MFGFVKAIRSISLVLSWVAGIILVIIMLLTIINIIARTFYQPMLGNNEIVAYAFAIVVAFGLAYTACEKRHVSVVVLVSRFPPRAQATISIIMNVLSIVVFAVIAWQGAAFGLEKWMTVGENDPVLNIPILPFRLTMTLGCTVLCLVFISDLFKLVREARKK
jgi:TRAP-type C4-dicarboxylate transport system permease small subunit